MVTAWLTYDEKKDERYSCMIQAEQAIPAMNPAFSWASSCLDCLN